jgi:hypothetical protein
LVCLWGAPVLSVQAVDQPPHGLIMNEASLDGFATCSPSGPMRAFLEHAYSSVQPVKKEAGLSTYAVRAEFLGLPVSALQMGICDDQSRDCGWAAFIGLLLDLPFAAAKHQLLQRTGLDYTQESRFPGSGGTRRPILSPVPSGEKSILFCDPGGL